MRSNPIVTWVAVIVLLILAALVVYFFFRSPTPPTGVLPPVTPPINGQIVPLPTGANKEDAKNDLETAMNQSGIDLNQYRTDAVATYPEGYDAEITRYISAPSKTSFSEPPRPNQSVMAWFDRLNSYGNGPLVYEVYFSIDAEFPRGILRNGDIEVELSGLFGRQEPPVGQAWAFFVEGSCYGCGCCDGVCGCLVCLP